MSGASKSSQEVFDRLQLIRSTNVGPVSYARLVARYGSASLALQALPELASRGGNRAPKIANADDIKKEMETSARLGAHFLFSDDDDYPDLLGELRNAPPVLISRGDLSLLNVPVVAIVGARNASAAACRFAQDIAKELANDGVAIVSGLARGIDTAAHRGSIDIGTIGVIAGGTDIYFPPENEALQEKIAKQGLLLSEQPPGTEPHARHFPFRNRIIAGLARGTVVIEAAPRSGSLITARLAAEAGRHVMAVPGSPVDPRSQGCNDLIREGATLIQSADEILEMVSHFDDRADALKQRISPREDRPPAQTIGSETKKPMGMSERMKIENLLSPTPVSIDEIIRQSHLPAPSIQLILLELELTGRVSRHAGARVSLNP